MRGLYIHIPFCKTLCSYCDFPKLILNEKNYEKYIDFLIAEIRNKKPLLKNITSVYIGGGTPNVLPINLLEKLFIEIKDYLLKENENTIEINPELLTNEQAILFNKYNINRVSIGVQTLNDDVLELINRHHNEKIVHDAFNILRNNNITNINCDFMFGIPNQTIEMLKYDLNFIKNLKPTHISYYSLILEEKTVFEYMLRNKTIELLNDDLIADMNDYINEELKNLGYKHYEISNHALDGYESKHNLLYWSEDEYVGVGCGASSFIRPRRFTNSRILARYYNNEIVDEEIIDLEAEKKEFMMLGLRKIDGISLNEYNLRYGNVFNDFNIDDLISKNLLEVVDGNIRIPKDKLFLANLVFEEFI